MKRLIFITFICFASLGLTNAQKNAIGLRLGAGAELLYQRNLSAKNFLQFTLAIPDYNGLSVTGIYNWRCCQWNWTPKTCEWYLNAGVGGALGIYDFDDSGVLIGIAGSCAFGCQFKKVPISLDINYRPVIGVVTSGHSEGFFDPGFWNFGIAAAYHF
ncbi:hypothetical protein [uncultured Coprobacter sp.]|uniref:hypothetical protein n=1 Tax=Coprobacter secundus TaxID=1501392 RepID=UPI0025983110|nr:hypothetical protein [uncultured Coprobacter sp.]